MARIPRFPILSASAGPASSRTLPTAALLLESQTEKPLMQGLCRDPGLPLVAILGSGARRGGGSKKEPRPLARGKEDQVQPGRTVWAWLQPEHPPTGPRWKAGGQQRPGGPRKFHSLSVCVFVTVPFLQRTGITQALRIIVEREINTPLLTLRGL